MHVTMTTGLDFCPYMVMTPLASTWLVEIPYTQNLLDNKYTGHRMIENDVTGGTTSVLKYFIHVNDVKRP